MRWRRWVLVVGAAVSSVSCACSCVSFPDLLPRDGAVNVPTNVVLRAMYPSASSTAPVATLVRQDTQETVELIDSAGPTLFLRSFTPTTPLAPRTVYVFTVAERPMTFTTGDGEDHVAPATPALERIDFAASSTCGPRRAWTLHFTSDDDAALVFAQTANSDEVADAAGVTQAASAMLTEATCGSNFTPPEGTSFSLAVQAMDLAGNLSGLSSSRQASGCSTTPSLAVVLAALWLRRRNRERGLRRSRG